MIYIYKIINNIKVYTKKIFEAYIVVLFSQESKNNFRVIIIATISTIIMLPMYQNNPVIKSI